jgi:endonuclease/exonuclease/phosphatase family metal-dependent hydrolase
MELTFGSYNFEYGGIDDGDDARLRRQLAMLDGIRAHVWAFQECSSWKDNGALYVAEEALGMRGFIARSARHPGGDIAVFVNESWGIKVIPPGERHEEKPPYWHGVALVAAEIDGFGPVRFASAHLAPSAPTLRVVEAEAFQLIAEKPVPLIAGGDWNAYPLGDPEPDAHGVHPGKARRKADTRAAEALAEYMIDVGSFLCNTTPTVGHRGDKLPYRCDRVYTTLPGSTIEDIKVFHEEDPQSDHRPVMATFTLGDRP